MSARSRHCRYCDESGHDARNCPDVPADQARPPRKLVEPGVAARDMYLLARAITKGK